MTEILRAELFPRHRVFVLKHGTFVLQQDDGGVCDLLYGQQYGYESQDYGCAITDYELEQLRAIGRVADYDADTVWIYPPSDTHPLLVTQQRSYKRRRSFYLNTTLVAHQLPLTLEALQHVVPDAHFNALVREGHVVIVAQDDEALPDMKAAERLRRKLIAHDEALFGQTAIAFVEDFPYYGVSSTHATAKPTLPAQDASVVSGRRVVLLTAAPLEQQAIAALLQPLGAVVQVAGTAAAGLELLEDFRPHLLITSARLPDMHGWELIAKIKEIGILPNLLKIMLADDEAAMESPIFAMAVGRVDVYLVKPVSMVQLQQQICQVVQDGMLR